MWYILPHRIIDCMRWCSMENPIRECIEQCDIVLDTTSCDLEPLDKELKESGVKCYNGELGFVTLHDAIWG